LDIFAKLEKVSDLKEVNHSKIFVYSNQLAMYHVLEFLFSYKLPLYSEL